LTGFARKVRSTEKISPAKGAKAQRKPFRNAAALCAFARKIFSEKYVSSKALLT
jgi:hypothetical protein